MEVKVNPNSKMILNTNGIHFVCIDSSMEDGREIPSVTLAVIGAIVTIVLVAILVTLTAVLTCAVMTFYKSRGSGRQDSPEVELEKQETKSDYSS